MAAKRCPFRENPARSKNVGDAFNLDCDFCEIRIEISKAAYGTPCADAQAVLRDVQERMAPRIDPSAMQQPAPEA